MARVRISAPDSLSTKDLAYCSLESINITTSADAVDASQPSTVPVPVPVPAPVGMARSHTTGRPSCGAVSRITDARVSSTRHPSATQSSFVSSFSRRATARPASVNAIFFGTPHARTRSLFTRALKLDQPL